MTTDTAEACMLKLSVLGSRNISYFVRRLRSFGVSSSILRLFYRATFQSVIRCVITSICGNLSVQAKSQVLRITTTLKKKKHRLYSLTSTPGNLSTVSDKQGRSAQTHVLHLGYHLLPLDKRDNMRTQSVQMHFRSTLNQRT